VLAATALNASYVLQHVGSADAPAVSIGRPLRSARGLLRSRIWVAGLALGLTGWGLHCGALALAPLSLVQAFSAAGIALVAVAAVRYLGERIGRSEMVAIALLVAALVSLSLGLETSNARATATLGMFAYLAGGAVVAALLAASFRTSTRRPQLLGAAAGILYGAADTATKAATGIADHSGLLSALLSPTVAAIALLSGGAFFCFQRGLQTGLALPVVALMSAATNLVAILGGIVVFGDPLGTTPLVAAVHLVAFALVGVGAWLLAPAQARAIAPDEEPDGRTDGPVANRPEAAGAPVVAG
jgi:drug/metabolite transporter (DMT)-like permease